MKPFLSTAVNDFKLIFRDPSLRTFLFMPVLILLIVCFLCPYLKETYPEVAPYIIYIVIMSCTQASTMYGFIYSIVFLDERDTEVSKMYGVLPISKSGFLLNRLFAPYLLSTLTTFVILMLQPLYSLTVLGSVLFASLFGLLAPILALAVGTLANNKIEGMTWFKGLNLIVALPLAAFFLPEYKYLFSFIPTFWAYTGMHHFIMHQGYLFYLSVGFLFTLLTLGLLVRFFVKRHFV
jgi:fluoroquinolone transport system permease protein